MVRKIATPIPPTFNNPVILFSIELKIKSIAYDFNNLTLTNNGRKKDFR